MGAKHATIRTAPRPSTRRATVAAVAIAGLLAAGFAPGAATEQGDDAEGPDLLDVDLAFVDQPAHAQVGAVITSVAFEPDSDELVSVGLTITVKDDALVELAETYAASLRQQLQEAGVPRPHIDRALEEFDVEAELAQALDDALDDEFEIELGLVNGPELDAKTASRHEDDATTYGPAEFRPSIDTAARAYRMEAELDTTIDVELEAISVDVRHGSRVVTAKVDTPLEVDVAATSDPSDAFNVFEKVVSCTEPPCQVGLTSPDNFQASVSTDASAGVLALSFSDEGLCRDVPYQGLPVAVLFDSAGVESQKRATFLIDRDTVQHDADGNWDPNNGAAHYDICMVSEDPFHGKGGPAEPFEDPIGGDLKFGPALLEDCHRLPSSASSSPCLEARSGFKGGGVKLVVRLPENDPWMR